MTTLQDYIGNSLSVTGGYPMVEHRNGSRTKIHKLGSNIWQMDVTIWATIQMLYLVEFANWSTEKTIGRGLFEGLGNNRYSTTGYTDDMQYHTGTMGETRKSNAGIQYRNIEGLYDNNIIYVILYLCEYQL